jgi:ParB-like chromosome segregation protein Spo0J
MNLTINEEFAQLIPPLSSEELEKLEKSLVNEGCLNPLIVWNNTIIDGHHRYAICIKHNISFEIIEKTELETELDVKLWMINNQFSRRNLAIETRLALAYRFKELEAEKAKERQLSALKQFSKQEESAELSQFTDSKVLYTRPEDISEQKQETGRTLEAIAKKAGVSHTTAFQYDKIQQQGTEEQKAKVAEGKSSINKVYTEIKQAKQSEEERKVVHLKLKGSGVVVIQKYVSGIYNELEDFNTSKDLMGIRHALLNSYLGQKENFLACVSNIDKHKKLVTRNLTALSESVEDLELTVNQGKHIIRLEGQKDKKISKIYERYYG